MKRKKGLLAIILVTCLLLSIITRAQFRVIGYVPALNADSDLNKISFQQLTHLNIAFVNPDSTGKLLLPQGFDTIIKKAHEYKVKVLASIGGGSGNPYYAGLLQDSSRAALVMEFIQLTADHELDGIDVDLEGGAIDTNYVKLISDLSNGLKPLNKLLTAALATWNGDGIANEALEKFDFVNIMSYDQTGPWRPAEPGPHSTFIKAEEDLQYWNSKRGIPKKKINLGLPFYGYCFGIKDKESMSFADIISVFPGAEKLDVIIPRDGGIIYYNGIPTIKRKTKLALENTGGVMIWQLLQDAQGMHSLLNAIHNTIK